MTEARPERRGRKKMFWVGLVYAALLLASNVVILLRAAPGPGPVPAGAERLMLTVPRATDAGLDASRTEALSVLRWNPPEAKAGAVPVVLLHGSPSGGGSDFAAFAPRLAERGSVVYAVDLPPFGASPKDLPSFSILSGAYATLAALDALGIERAHVLGWSQGGGPAIHMASMAPERVASLTMLASIGMQETEGSGSFFFEHFKYRFAQTLLNVVPELVPHFGLLGSRTGRWTLLRQFSDTDLRPMKKIMEGLTTPTLILHGRHDFLVPAWAAEEHHRVIGPSTLVMLNADHFIPMGDTMPMGRDEERSQEMEIALRHLKVFLAMHDAPGRAGLRGLAEFSPPEAHMRQSLGGIDLSRTTPWWVVILVIIAATFISEDLATITVGLLIVSQSIDFGVAMVGCFLAIFGGDVLLWVLGRTLGRRILKWPFIGRVITEKSLAKWGRVLDEHTGKAVILSRCLPGTRLPTFIAAGILSKKPLLFLFWVGVAALVWTPFLLGLTMLLGPSVLEVFKKVFHGPWAIVAAVASVFVVVRIVEYETTEMGRDRLKADAKRLIATEFWPAWLFYLPWVPYFAWLSLRHWGALVFTCANPGIACGGGMLGERKSEILQGLAAGTGKDAILPWALVPEGPDHEARAQRALREIAENPALRGFPVILKPDQAFRGYGLKLARREADVRAYFKVMTRPVMVQAYGPGPSEIGVLWSRVPRAGARVDEWPGEILSVTAKTFPVIEGDGEHTLEHLVWDHPRFRMQAKVFLKRYAEQTDRVLGQGERMALAVAGNHCQGTMFSDGMPLVTPELAAWIDAAAQSFRDPATGAGLDFGRFDIRYGTAEELGRAQGLAIVELNGTSSESTSMYDPGKPVWWTYGLLFRHWKRLFVIGAARRREGARAMSIGELWAALRAHRKQKPGSAISD